MSEITVFHKILAGEIPADKVYEDERCIVIRDIQPQAPVHLLCIPKEFIRDVSSISQETDPALLGHLLFVASQVARNEGIESSGYRLIFNCGEDSGQEVPYLHLHIIGGKKLPSLG
ncbi:histidine triad nucleotide-binding protein [bacterium]|nr:histidine triad nucleotide-binding protein [bacterium]